ncbi:MAG TPA: DUF3048 domain-containing protein, partial [Streptosporangiaceae bacterium]
RPSTGLTRADIVYAIPVEGGLSRLMAIFSSHYPPVVGAVRTSRFKEYGRRPPFAESTGSGSAVVLRAGRTWAVHWSRPTANGGTTFTTASGQPMTFARGQVWVVLAYR